MIFFIIFLCLVNPIINDLEINPEFITEGVPSHPSDRRKKMQEEINCDELNPVPMYCLEKWHNDLKEKKLLEEEYVSITEDELKEITIDAFDDLVKKIKKLNKVVESLL